MIRSRLRSPIAFAQTATYRCPRASKWASKCAPAISIRWGIRGCRATHAENSERSIETTAFSFFRIPTRISSARSRSMFTPCVSPRASCGASKLRPAIPFFSICGMTTLSQPDLIRDPENLAAVPELPRDAGGPVFAEPWQAQAFALAVKLSEPGHFTWKEWAAALAEELNAAASRGEPDDGSRYYHHWLAALHPLVAAKGLSDPAAMLARKEAWVEAYPRTPHGKPVELSANSRAPQRE